MRIRRSGSRIVVDRRDGSHVQFSMWIVLFFVAPVALIAIAIWGPGREERGAASFDELRALAENLLTATPPPRETQLDTIHLVIPNNQLVDLERALASGDPALGAAEGGSRPFLNAVFVDDDEFLPCEIAFLAPRGHHDSAKPCLRVKFRKADARDRARRIDLYRPTDALAIDAIRYAQCAAALDVIDDQPRNVRLFVNRKPFGVYVRTRPPGRALSIDARRDDGLFLFSRPGMDPWSGADRWTQFGRPDTADAPLDRLFEALASGDPEQLARIADVDAFARWYAARAVVGRTHFPTAQYALFYCPRVGRFEPVAWGYDGVRGPADAAAAEDRMGTALARDPNWVRFRDESILGLLDGGASTAAQRDLVYGLLTRSDADLRADLRIVERDLTSGRLVPVTIESLDRRRDELVRWIVGRDAWLRSAVGPTEQRPPGEPIRLGPGAVTLTEDLRTAPGQALEIAPDTTLRLAAGVSIHARGQVQALGTAERPIRIVSASFEPWGTFMLEGHRANRSRLQHVSFEDGSVDRGATRSIKAYVAVLQSELVEFDHCRFGPNAVEADSLQIYRAQVNLQNCVFEDARRDALDIQYSFGMLRDCKVVGAERNGIDLSGSNYTLHRCLVGGALRAALSVGERSRAHVLESDLRSSDLGVECRDDARVVLEGTGLRDCRIGVLTERIDWRAHRGGSVGLVNCRIERSRDHDVEIGKRGEVRSHRSPEFRVKGKKKVVADPELSSDWLWEDS